MQDAPLVKIWVLELFMGIKYMVPYTRSPRNELCSSSQSLSKEETSTNPNQKTNKGDTNSGGSIVIITVSRTITVAAVRVAIATGRVVTIVFAVAIVVGKFASIDAVAWCHGAAQLARSLLEAAQVLLVGGVDDADHAVGALVALGGVEGDGRRIVHGDAEDLVLQIHC